jgi:hypothetical protein
MKRLSPFLFILSLPLLDSCTPGGADSPRPRDAVSSSGSGAGPIVESKRSVTGRILMPPAIEGIEDIHVRIAISSGKEINAGWPGWHYAMFVNTGSRGTDLASPRHRKTLLDRAASKMDPSQEYQIELLTQNDTGSGDSASEILRISKNGRIVIDASVCQIHKRTMKRQMEDVCSADSYPESFFPLQKREFPNDGNFYSGCSQQSDPTWKCPECSRSYVAWSKRHGWK